MIPERKKYFEDWRKKLIDPENLQFDSETLKPLENTVERLETYKLFAKEIFKKNHSLLEVGCNKGFFSFLFSKNFNKIIAIDCFSENIRFCKELQKEHGIKNIDFLTIDCNSFFHKHKGGLFDIIFFGQCTHHIIRSNLIQRVEQPLQFLISSAMVGQKFIIIDAPFSLDDPTVNYDCIKYKFTEEEKEYYSIHKYCEVLYPEFTLEYLNWSGDGATRKLAIFKRRVN